MNAGCAPERIRLGHGVNQRPNLPWSRWPSAPRGGFGEVGPVSSEALAMPTNYGVRMNHDQSTTPVFPHMGQPDPKPAVPSDQARTFLLTFVNGELLSKREVLQNHRAVTLSEKPDQSKQAQEDAEHSS